VIVKFPTTIAVPTIDVGEAEAVPNEPVPVVVVPPVLLMFTEFVPSVMLTTNSARAVSENANAATSAAAQRVKSLRMIIPCLRMLVKSKTMSLTQI
jgi:hypothetical protein